MAEQIPYGIASSLINMLGSAALREFGRIYGVMDELEKIKNTVESIRAVLLDAEEKQEQSHAVQNWVRRLKDVLHPADDLLDEFVIEDTRHKMDESRKSKVKQVLHSLSPNRIVFRHKMAHEIEKIQNKFNDVVKDMSGLNLNPNVVVIEKSNNVRRETSSFVFESDIIGREDDKKYIINMLKQPHENHNISGVAIVGIGGLGKTTLAQLTYSDGEVKNLFEMSMWVCVSDNFDVKTILKNMLESLIKKKVDDLLSLDNLQNMFRENLADKKYLLVLDDVWNESHQKWAELRTYLMCGAPGSKILVTTRSKIVAQTMGISDPYVLNGLNEEESWNLLKKITFGDDTIGVNQTLESIGKKIAKKCKGVPLAIRSLGGLLQSKIKEKEWNNVLQDDIWKLCDDKDNILPVLKLSHQNLSPEQRQCFMYCSLYPKDWVIEKDDLIQMWMAQGYLDYSVEGQCMEDVGNQLVNVFLMKSFFQDAKMNEEGDITSFKMHDLMHDLATQVACKECCYLNSKEKRGLGKPMHVSVEFNALCLLEALDVNSLRTLIVWPSRASETLDKEDLLVISKFKILRVLRMKDISLRELSGFIEKMKHLRYLNLLRCHGLESILKSMGNLVCLQTVKTSLNKVVLQTKVDSKLINLKHLEIYNRTYDEMAPAVYEKLHIQHQECAIFSNWLYSLRNIFEISLICCRGIQYLPPLERLPFLKSLNLHLLYDLEYIHYEEPILEKSFFPSLESLYFRKCKNLEGWRRKKDSSNNVMLLQFPCLSILTISDCQMLISMPTFPNIKRLSLDDFSAGLLLETLNIPYFPSGTLPLSLLKSLEINECFMELPMDWLENLTSLETLQIYDLSSQQFEVLEIWFKDELNYLPSLKTITFYNCGNLEALPDWICDISSLRQINATFCIKLVSLPEGILRLTNLCTLEIMECPILIEECRAKTSAIWPKIAHIPNIILH